MKDFGVMLAHSWKGADPTGWWMSEKLDGMRAYWTGRKLFTRTGKLIAAPKWFTAALPSGVELDGELSMGRGKFQETISVVRKSTPRDPRWKAIKYSAFDAPSDAPFEARMAVLKRAVRQARTKYHRGRKKTSRGAPLQAVRQIKSRNKAHLAAFHDKIVAEGAEGVMLRKPGSAYSRKRSWDLQKVKNFLDTEAVITGYTEGTGRHLGRLGAYRAKLLDSGKAFRVGTGISDRERERPLRKGTVVTIRFFEYTKSGAPRFPVLVGARDYE